MAHGAYAISFSRNLAIYTELKCRRTTGLEIRIWKDYRGIMLKGHDIVLICVNSVSPSTQRTGWGHRNDTVQDT